MRLPRKRSATFAGTTVFIAHVSSGLSGRSELTARKIQHVRAIWQSGHLRAIQQIAAGPIDSRFGYHPPRHCDDAPPRTRRIGGPPAQARQRGPHFPGRAQNQYVSVEMPQELDVGLTGTRKLLFQLCNGIHKPSVVQIVAHALLPRLTRRRLYCSASSMRIASRFRYSTMPGGPAAAPARKLAAASFLRSAIICSNPWL